MTTRYGVFLQSARIQRVMAEHLLIQLFAGQNDFLSIDDDYKITCIYIGSELRLILSS